MGSDKSFGRAMALIKGILDDLPIIVVIVDSFNNIIYQNNESKCVLGSIANPSRFHRIMNPLVEIARSEPGKDYEINYNNRWYKMSVADTIWLDENPVRVVIGADITRIKSSEKRFKHFATTDTMTGLYNRQTGIELLNEHIIKTKNGGPLFSVCYFDINDLKYVNDTFGHPAGDNYIQAVVKSAQKSIRQTDIFARMGGDEFMILFINCTASTAADIMCLVNARLDIQASLVENKTLHYSISFGVLEVTAETNDDAESILSSADSKMYCMKKEYRLMKKRWLR